MGRIDPLGGVRAQLVDFARAAGPVVALRAQLRLNEELLMNVRSRVIADAGATAALFDPLGGVRAQLVDFARAAGPVVALRAQLRLNEELLMNVRSRVIADAGATAA
ncbi:hypothetical protein ABZ832_28630, partial [Streptantibioticus parmotrematis]|uniref:hypothetical protein n=1 Tax=Streptantibioticus parmotrematis TaxID=2873249 RepID=UPI003400D9B6